MCNTATLQKGIPYAIKDGPPAGILPRVMLRTVPLTFFIEVPSRGEPLALSLDITATVKKEFIHDSSGLFMVGIEGRVCDDHDQQFFGTYNPATHEGTLCFS